MNTTYQLMPVLTDIVFAFLGCCLSPLQVFALTFIKGYRPLVFHLPFWAGVAFGVVMQLSSSPCCKASMNISGFKIGNGTYSTLLGFNVVSTVVCWGLAAITLLDNRSGNKLEGVDEEEYGGHDGVHGKVQGPDRGNSLLGLPVPAFLRSSKGSGKGAAAGVVSKDVADVGPAVSGAGGAAGGDVVSPSAAGGGVSAAHDAAGDGTVAVAAGLQDSRGV